MQLALPHPLLALVFLAFSDASPSPVWHDLTPYPGPRRPQPLHYRRQQDGGNDPDPVFPRTLPTRIGFVYPLSPIMRSGENITLGFADPPPLLTLPGLFRQITPLVTFPNRTVIALAPFGTLEMDPPFSPFWPPVYPEGWCAVHLGGPAGGEGRGERWWVVGGYEGEEPLEIGVELNVTWGLPTYTGADNSTNCTSPGRVYRTLFASHTLTLLPPSSSSPAPRTGARTTPLLPATTSLSPLSPTSPPWPDPPVSHAADPARRAFALLGGLLALAVLAACATGGYLVRERRKRAMGDYRVAGAARGAGAEEMRGVARGR